MSAIVTTTWTFEPKLPTNVVGKSITKYNNQIQQTNKVIPEDVKFALQEQQFQMNLNKSDLFKFSNTQSQTLNFGFNI